MTEKNIGKWEEAMGLISGMSSVLGNIETYRIALKNFNQDLKLRSDNKDVSNKKYGLAFMLNNLCRIKDNYQESLQWSKEDGLDISGLSGKLNYLEMRN